MNPQGHLIYRLRNAILHSYPYSHFFAEDVFPHDFYQQLLASLPTDAEYKAGAADYFGRRFADPTENPLLKFMGSQDFALSIIKIFPAQFEKHFAGQDFKISFDLRLVRDKQAYQIGPHTDTPRKLVSLLFYLPDEYDNTDLGTSIFIPKQRDYTCKQGKHHSFDKFDKIFTAPFQPNSCFGFFRTDNSFHGVEPITIPITRDVLLYNLYDASQ